jgi:DNA polymerase I
VKILLLDGNSLTYRAFFALPPDMATAGGQITNAVYGFTAMLTNLLRDQQPDGVLVAFDRPEPTFRHMQEPLYKAQRESSPEELRQQMGLVREVLTAAGVTCVELAGFEADDVIATVAERARLAGHDVVIVTGDRDSFQLVSDPHVKVLYNKRGVSDYDLYDEAGIVNRTGVTPAQYPEYAALRGDTSDNLPGVPGVGEKTAAKLITGYGGLDGIFANVDAQTPKLKASLIEHEQRARTNYDLMLLRRDAPVEVDLDSLAPQPDVAALQRLFDLLEFRNMGSRALEALGVGGADSGESSAATLEPVVQRLDSVADVVATNWYGAARACLAAAWQGEPGRTALTGVAVVDDVRSARVHWLPAAVALATDWSSITVQGHHTKALMRSLLEANRPLFQVDLDVGVVGYLIDPASARYDIASLLDRYTTVGVATGSVPDGQLDLGGGADSSGDRARVTASEALAVAALVEPLRGALEASGMTVLHDDIERPLVAVLAKMEHVGVGVDRAELSAINDRLRVQVDELTRQLHDVVGRPFNPNSPNQLREILYTERKLTPGKKTKTGFSTDAATLERLRDEWPEFIDPLLRYREVEKLRGTYGEGLLAEVAADGRIHATFQQTVARTGRLSSDHPNLHNIPVRSDEGRVFRRAFVPAEGFTLLVADYNQIELRCIAHLAHDPGLIDAFVSGQDLHRATAARVFGVDPGEVNLDQRSRAKMISYGLAYGMEAFGLAQRLAIGTGEAAAILEAYFTAFPNVRAYMDRTVAEAKDRGYTETLFGRRRPMPELRDPNQRVRQAAERQAMNAGIQGLAADIFKVALVRIDAALSEGGYDSRLVLQVHDEVVVEVAHSEVDVVGPLVLGLMRGAAELSVPLEVNVAWGDTWAEAKG